MKKKEESPQNQVTQTFALVVTRVLDGSKGLVNVRARSEGIPMEEALFYVDGWLDKTRDELKKKYFGSMQITNDDKGEVQ